MSDTTVKTLRHRYLGGLNGDNILITKIKTRRLDKNCEIFLTKRHARGGRLQGNIEIIDNSLLFGGLASGFTFITFIPSGYTTGFL